MLFDCRPKVLHKHCLQFLLGVKKAPRETENNAYAKFWGEKQRTLWYVMVFLEWSIVKILKMKRVREGENYFLHWWLLTEQPSRNVTKHRYFDSSAKTHFDFLNDWSLYKQFFSACLLFHHTRSVDLFYQKHFPVLMPALVLTCTPCNSSHL